MAQDLNNHLKSRRYGIISALIAACMFGAGAPVSKILLRDIPPVMFAGLLYLGSWAGLSLYSIAKNLTGNGGGRESRLKGADYLYLAGSVLSGGIAAPLFLLYGLLKTSGSVTALLLNTEGILTTLLAAFIFKEHVTRRLWIAAVLMLAAGATLTYMPAAEGWTLHFGSLLVLASALMWAIDNNLTRELSHRDPILIAMHKGLAAGVINISIALFLGEAGPGPGASLWAVIFGALGYGASLVFFIYALRNLGTSRTIIYFGAAPFIGVIASIIILNESMTAQLFFAALLMISGLWLILREYHDHEHTHEPITHEHGHCHDEHHGHLHEGGRPDDDEPHCHEHGHAGITHSHAHVPDLHHHHKH